jgi:hypothetical protein
MLSVGAFFYLGFLVLGFEQGYFLQTDIPLCGTEIEPLVHDILFSVIYIIGSLNLVIYAVSELVDLKDVVGKDNSEDLKSGVKTYIKVVLFLIGVDVFLTIFANINVGCLTPGFPPAPHPDGFIN